MKFYSKENWGHKENHFLNEDLNIPYHYFVLQSFNFNFAFDFLYSYLPTFLQLPETQAPLLCQQAQE